MVTHKRAQRAWLGALGLILGWAAVAQTNSDLAVTPNPPPSRPPRPQIRPHLRQRLPRARSPGLAPPRLRRWRILDRPRRPPARTFPRAPSTPRFRLRQPAALPRLSPANRPRPQPRHRRRRPTRRIGADQRHRRRRQSHSLFCDAITARATTYPTKPPIRHSMARPTPNGSDFAAGHPTTRASWIQWRYLDHTALVLTNLHQIHALRARAARSLQSPPRRNPRRRRPLHPQLCLLDPTGHIDIDPASWRPASAARPANSFDRHHPLARRPARHPPLPPRRPPACRPQRTLAHRSRTTHRPRRRIPLGRSRRPRPNSSPPWTAPSFSI